MKKMLKHISALIICTLLAVCIVPAIASAETIDSEPEVFESGYCGIYPDIENVVWTLYDDGHLVISGTGNTENYTFDYINEITYAPWGEYADKIVKLTVENGITSIGDNAFYGCTALEEVTIPEGVETIERNTFYGCTALEEVTIPEGVETIEYDAFYNCSSLKTVTLPETLTTIGSSAFFGCTALEEITIPESVETIEYNTFYGCSSLKTITLSETLKTIGSSAFEGCTSLKTVTIPESLTYIGYEAFKDCTAITDVYYGGSELMWDNIDTTFGNYYLDSYEKLHYAKRDITLGTVVNGTVTLSKTVAKPGETVTVSATANSGYEFAKVYVDKKPIEGNTFVVTDNHIVTACFRSVSTGLAIVDCGDCGEDGDNIKWTLYDDGHLVISGTGNMREEFGYDFDTDITCAPWGAYVDEVIKVTVENGVEFIGWSAFHGMYNLKDVVIADSVKDLGAWTFRCCTSLENIKFPATLTEIQRELFVACTSLKKITLPSTLTKISYGVFAECTSLEEVTIPEGVQVLDFKLFVDCTSLKKVTLPKSLKTIYNNVFEGCTALADVYYNGSESMWQAVSKGVENTALESATIHFAAEDDLAAPTNVKATNDAATGKPVISWSKVDGAVKYQVWRSTSKDGTYGLMKTVAGTTLTNANAVAGKLYYYKVVAVDANGNKSAASAIVQRTADLAKVTGVKVTNDAATGKPVISWDKVDGATSYKVYRSTAQNGTYGLMGTYTGTTMTNKNAVAGKTYFYRVMAVHSNANANSVHSAVVKTVCDLPQVTGVKAVNDAATGKPKISWNKVEGAAKYQVWRSTAKDGKYTLMNTVTTTSMINKNAVAGKLYYYKVVAMHSNTNANSAYSAIVQRTADLARPTVTVKIGTTGKPVLSWNKVDGAVKYQIYRSTAQNGTYTLINTVTGTSTTNKNAVAGTKYFYKVVAVHSNTNANSAYSAVVSIISK